MQLSWFISSSEVGLFKKSDVAGMEMVINFFFHAVTSLSGFYISSELKAKMH